MGKFSILVAASIFAVGLTAISAPAADLDYELPRLEMPEEFGGWYLRGDISIDWVDDFDTTYVGNTFTSSELDQGFNFGIGVGYQFNKYFRADFTIERFSSDFSGSTAGSCAYDTGGVIVEGSCTSTDSAEFSAWSTMANGYFELGNYHGFTPYAGAGIGASYVSWDNYVSLETCTRPSVVTDSCYTAGDSRYTAPGAGAASTTTAVNYSGDGSWRFSYALMAGFSYDLWENLKLDAGYKYTNAMDGTMLPDIGGGISVNHGDIGIHAVRLGLRYQIW